MRALVQRVAQARVEIGGRVAGRIDAGLLVLLCAMRGDTAVEGERLLAKLLKLRIFSDADGRMNLSLAQTGGGLLVVSQFTLAADGNGGNRPSFSAAAPPDAARALYDGFVAAARAAHAGPVACGEFGADMQVHLVNDGPVTLMLEMPPAAAA